MNHCYIVTNLQWATKKPPLGVLTLPAEELAWLLAMAAPKIGATVNTSPGRILNAIGDHTDK